ncbi:hypothetical protein SAMN04515674_113105 [Pseudarcicella hirudinis]|uniref:Lipoprotein n=1 Tax=Pseudarcicella hirudinis TaxID=1079859 RepID=A0A1I5X3X6_9BACT|nr:hypothetical protein [Pseudarcicella hirudinis]SFQ26377.1 hypothetical protein SAMN04515674_113105 [Pseudarcicella hirudinis]
MRSAIFLLFISSFILSCDQLSHNNNEAIDKKRKLPPDYTIVQIEGCEYFRIENTHGYANLTHKGNCKNPIHCYNDTTKAKLIHQSKN